jgi:hypothetical protein
MRRAVILSTSLLARMSSLAAAESSSWPFWDRYATHFLSPDGRVIDPDRNKMTTSKGQSYALFFALFANDPVPPGRLQCRDHWGNDLRILSNSVLSSEAWVSRTLRRFVAVLLRVSWVSGDTISRVKAAASIAQSSIDASRLLTRSLQRISSSSSGCGTIAD